MTKQEVAARLRSENWQDLTEAQRLAIAAELARLRAREADVAKLVDAATQVRSLFETVPKGRRSAAQHWLDELTDALTPFKEPSQRMTYEEIVETGAAAMWACDAPDTPWYTVRDDVQEGYRISLRAALSALRALAEAGGYRLMVPREADYSMQNAAIDTHPHELGNIAPVGLRMSPQKLFAECYAAMISAAPDPTQEPE